MTEEEIKAYAEKIDSDIQGKLKEIDTNISYIIIGAIGFFITMLDKFIDVNEAYCIPIMIISFISLLLAFGLFLFGKHSMTKHAYEMLDFIDDILLPTPGNKKNEQKLLKMWKKSKETMIKTRKYIYFFLGMGVLLQVLFFTINIFYEKKKENKTENTLRIEVITKDSISIKSDSSLIINTTKSY